jgi:hypothetical protein
MVNYNCTNSYPSVGEKISYTGNTALQAKITSQFVKIIFLNIYTKNDIKNTYNVYYYSMSKVNTKYNTFSEDTSLGDRLNMLTETS